MTLRRLAALALILCALPALAYVLPASAILRMMGQRRAKLELVSLEVHGTLQVEGAAAARLGPALRAAPGAALQVPARLQVKVPGRCRLELLPPGVPEAERPSLSVRDGGAVTGHGGLDAVPAAVALVRGTCAVLATPTAGDASEAYAAALARLRIGVTDVSLGRFDGRIAYVIGGRDRDRKPLFFVSKDDFLPLRLVVPEGNGLADVRLVGWGSNVGGDWFPRAAEAWEGTALQLRLTAEKAIPNPRLPDAIF